MPKYLENVLDKNSGTSFNTEIAEINHWHNDDTNILTCNIMINNDKVENYAKTEKFLKVL